MARIRRSAYIVSGGGAVSYKRRPFTRNMSPAKAPRIPQHPLKFPSRLPAVLKRATKPSIARGIREGSLHHSTIQAPHSTVGTKRPKGQTMRESFMHTRSGSRSKKKTTKAERLSFNFLDAQTSVRLPGHHVEGMFSNLYHTQSNPNTPIKIIHRMVSGKPSRQSQSVKSTWPARRFKLQNSKYANFENEYSCSGPFRKGVWWPWMYNDRDSAESQGSQEWGLGTYTDFLQIFNHLMETCFDTTFDANYDKASLLKDGGVDLLWSLPKLSATYSFTNTLSQSSVELTISMMTPKMDLGSGDVSTTQANNSMWANNCPLKSWFDPLTSLAGYNAATDAGSVGPNTLAPKYIYPPLIANTANTPGTDPDELRAVSTEIAYQAGRGLSKQSKQHWHADGVYKCRLLPLQTVDITVETLLRNLTSFKRMMTSGNTNPDGRGQPNTMYENVSIVPTITFVGLPLPFTKIIAGEPGEDNYRFEHTTQARTGPAFIRASQSKWITYHSPSTRLNFEPYVLGQTQQDKNPGFFVSTRSVDGIADQLSANYSQINGNSEIFTRSATRQLQFGQTYATGQPIAGLQQYQVDGFTNRQALPLVNIGSGTTDDVLDRIEDVRTRVVDADDPNNFEQTDV